MIEYLLMNITPIATELRRDFRRTDSHEYLTRASHSVDGRIVKARLRYSLRPILPGDTVEPISYFDMIVADAVYSIWASGKDRRKGVNISPLAIFRIMTGKTGSGQVRKNAMISSMTGHSIIMSLQKLCRLRIDISYQWLELVYQGANNDGGRMTLTDHFINSGYQETIDGAEEDRYGCYVRSYQDMKDRPETADRKTLDRKVLTGPFLLLSPDPAGGYRSEKGHLLTYTMKMPMPLYLLAEATMSFSRMPITAFSACRYLPGDEKIADSWENVCLKHYLFRRILYADYYAIRLRWKEHVYNTEYTNSLLIKYFYHDRRTGERIAEDTPRHDRYKGSGALVQMSFPVSRDREERYRETLRIHARVLRILDSYIRSEYISGYTILERDPKDIRLYDGRIIGVRLKLQRQIGLLQAVSAGPDRTERTYTVSTRLENAAGAFCRSNDDRKCLEMKFAYRKGHPEVFWLAEGDHLYYFRGARSVIHDPAGNGYIGLASDGTRVPCHKFTVTACKPTQELTTAEFQDLRLVHGDRTYLCAEVPGQDVPSMHEW